MRAVWVIALVLSGCLADKSAPNTIDPQAERDAGVRPPTGDPCVDGDRDGDGFATDPACGEVDCDDTNIGIHPGAAEACNGLDEDCDRTIDEDLGEGACGVGPCRRVVPFCQNGRPTACTPAAGSAETCNGIDDDCNGTADDGLAGEQCGTGACTRSASCVNGGFETCTPGAPGAESCNREDDDCDGVVDNGFRISVINGSYATLYGMHQGCDGGGQ